MTRRHLDIFLLRRYGVFNIVMVHGNLCLRCSLSPQTISITEEWELLAHEVKVDLDLTRRADTFLV